MGDAGVIAGAGVVSTDERFPVTEPDRSLGELIGELTTEFGALVGSHIDLAKAEIKEDLRDAGKAGGMLGGAGLAALLALIMGSAAAAWGLAEVMAAGWAFLAVAAVWSGVAAVLAMMGRKQVAAMSLGPQSTIEEVREDQKWLKTQTN